MPSRAPCVFLIALQADVPEHIFDCHVKDSTCDCVGDETKVAEGPLQPIWVTEERRKGRRIVNRVVGVEWFLVDPQALAAGMRKKFGAPSFVNALPGGSHEIVLKRNAVGKVQSTPLKPIARSWSYLA
jgi:translation initiation factor 1 (eIF-1/SUI1)